MDNSYEFNRATFTRKIVKEYLIQSSSDEKDFKILKSNVNNLIILQCKKDIRFKELGFDNNLIFTCNGKKLFNESVIYMGDQFIRFSDKLLDGAIHLENVQFKHFAISQASGRF
jgi:hypothetical protein